MLHFNCSICAQIQSNFRCNWWDHCIWSKYFVILLNWIICNLLTCFNCGNKNQNKTDFNHIFFFNFPKICLTNVCGNREEEVEEEYEEGGDEEEQGHLEYVTHNVTHDVIHQAPAEVDKWPLSFWMVNREIFIEAR